jgi:hypothetical protein
VVVQEVVIEEAVVEEVIRVTELEELEANHV